MQSVSQENYIIELVDWLTKHPKIQRRLFENDYEVEPEELIEILEVLEQNGFYDMIMVLLMKHQSTPILEQALTNFLIEKMEKEWERIGSEQICKEIKDKIREEIQRKKKER